ncbi:MAG: hypothetical protein IJB86_03940 [Clostridia bacterium]|nr:hypothetical protein [Clostridia bacterium]
MKYFLGIDGGGTKTEFLLLDESGHTVSDIVLESSNPTDVGMDNTKDVLAKGIEEVCRDIPLCDISVFAGIAGGITGNNRECIREYLSLFGFAHYDNGSDAQNCVAAALDTDNGITVIIGTGSVAFSQNNGKLFRCGGYGYLFEEGGSGFSIARDAIIASLRLEESDKSSVLSELLKEKLSCTHILDKVGELHKEGKRYIASLCPVVFEAFVRNDPTAHAILSQNMKCVADLITSSKEKSGLTDTPVRTILSGGVAKRSDILIPMIKEHLADKDDFLIDTIKKAPVHGAVILAKRGVMNA